MHNTQKFVSSHNIKDYSMTTSNDNQAVNNPLLEASTAPFGAIPYDRITLAHYIPAVKEAIAREEAAVNSICNSSDAATFDNTIAALDYAGLLLGDIIGAFNAVANACSNDEILAIEEEMQQLYVAHKNNITLNDKLFARVKAVYEGNNSNLTTEQKRLLAHYRTVMSKLVTFAVAVPEVVEMLAL